VYFSSFIPILRWRGVPTYIVTDILGLLMLGLVPGLWKMHPRALRALVIVQIVTVANELTMSLVLPDAGGAAAVQRFLLQAAILIALLIYFAIHTRLRTALFVRRR
ncbi:MAG TPA: hypothetical protein VKX46_15530, partial [Ktedonobacteraceae bacterium]|nr:hypothetical protein [Ktedonobacteraceae bacterium]